MTFIDEMNFKDMNCQSLVKHMFYTLQLFYNKFPQLFSFSKSETGEVFWNGISGSDEYEWHLQFCEKSINWNWTIMVVGDFAVSQEVFELKLFYYDRGEF